MTSAPSSHSDLIDGRYRLERQLGRGAQGTTYLAVHAQTGERVALKELDFAGLSSWDEVGVFEREAAVLGGLTHPNIPRIAESFRVETDDVLRLFLAQDFVDGKDLRQRLEDGEEFDENRLRHIAAEVLDILIYLHGYSPSVLHRDIKPANLIERHDGSIALVDFGAAQGAAHGKTVIGTSGYMPAEQLMGRAGPASDLFALGATLVHLATGTHPTELGHGLGLRWRHLVEMSNDFCTFVDRLVAPMPEDRYPTAVAARRQLNKERERVARELAVELGHERGDSFPAHSFKLSPGGNYRLIKGDGRIEILAPAKKSQRAVLIVLGLALLMIGLTAGTIVLVVFAVAITIALGLALKLQHLQGLSSVAVTDRGVEVVSRATDIVSLVPLDEVSGLELKPSSNGKANLVLWKASGRSVFVDFGDRDELEWFRGTVQSALNDARRRS